MREKKKIPLTKTTKMTLAQGKTHIKQKVCLRPAARIKQKQTAEIILVQGFTKTRILTHNENELYSGCIQKKV